MARHIAWRLGAVAVLASVIAGCALLERMEGRPDPTTRTGPGSGSGLESPAATEPVASQPAASQPTASEPIAIPDPLNPLTHQPGEEVQVAGATIVYLGLADATDGVIARFEVASGSLQAEPRLLTPSGVVALSPRGDALESDPFDAPTGADATLTLIVGETLVVFEAGPLP